MISEYLKNRDRIKIVASDIDGTLIGSDGEIGGLSLHCLRKLKDSGKIVTIASGRMYHNCLRYIEKIGISHFVVSTDGGYICNPSDGEVLDQFYFEEGVFDWIHRTVADFSTNYFIISTEDSIFSSSRADDEFIRFFGNRVEKFVNSPPPGFNALKIVVIDQKGIVSGLKEKLENSGFPGIKINTGPSLLHPDHDVLLVRKSEISKGNGLLRVCERYGISPDEVLVFGDWLNDISMFRLFSQNAAPSDCDESLRPYANYISEYNCQSDFVGKALEYIFFKD